MAENNSTNQQTAVIIFQRIIPVYRKQIFEILHERTGALICYSDPKRNNNLGNSNELEDIPCFKKIPRIYIGGKTTFVQQVLPILFQYRPKVIITGASMGNLTAWLLMLYRTFFRYKLIAWGHGIGNAEIKKPFSGTMGKIKLFFLQQFDGFILYSHDRKKILSKYFAKKPVNVAINTLNTHKLNTLYDRFRKEGKERIKEELGIKNKYNLIYIGRLIPLKRIDLLLETFSLLKETEPDVALHIVGEGPEQYLVEQRKNYIPDIYQYGRSYDEVWNGKMLFANDLMFMPGYVGLSIIHAMSFGCPVVTCRSDNKGPFHAPEYEHLKHGYNGWSFSSDAKVLAKEIKAILKDEPMLCEIQKNALMDIRGHAGIDKFVEGFTAAIEQVFNGN